ncbi:MAG: hypothetical protein IJ639_09195 [Ruminococcus sp.]|nr:hypothetical protein [Ruminococcus sp.]
MNRLQKFYKLQEWFNARRSELNSQPAMVSAIRADHEIEAIICDLYFSLYNKTLGGCGSCLADALIVILHEEERMKEIANCHFKLKTGVLLQDSKGKLPMVTVANITDDLAIAYLRDNIARKRFFAEMPEDVDVLIAGKAIIKENPTPKPEEKPTETPENPAEGEQKTEGEQVPTDGAKAPENGENGDENKLTAEAIKAMTYKELQAAGKDRGIKVVGMSKDNLIDALLATL